MLLLAQMTIVNPYLNASAPSGFSNMVINPNNLLDNPNNAPLFLARATSFPNSADGNSVNDAFRITPTTVTGQRAMVVQTPVVNGVTYEFAVYAKTDGYPLVNVAAGVATFGGMKYASANILTGVINGHNGLSAGVDDMENGWKRVWIRLLCVETGDTTFEVKIGAFPDDFSENHSFTGDGVSGMLFWGREYFIIP